LQVAAAPFLAGDALFVDGDRARVWLAGRRPARSKENPMTHTYATAATQYMSAISGRGAVRWPFREKTKNVRLLQSHVCGRGGTI